MYLKRFFQSSTLILNVLKFRVSLINQTGGMHSHYILLLIRYLINHICFLSFSQEQFIFVYECLRHFITAEPDYEDDERETFCNPCLSDS